MTTISAKIILDSISPQDVRLTTIQLRYPRFIHAEVMTHRVFSRNASSSRAIPVERLIQDILNDPVVPLHWGKNQKGMQADEECNEPIIFRNDTVSRESAWLRARDIAVSAAQRFSKAGYHKQIVNRLLEPFAHINVLITATEWTNFLALRDHRDAEPHIAMLARAIKVAMSESTPTLLQPGQWHLPYVTEMRDKFGLETLCKISTARCARLSYLTHDGKPTTIEADLKLYDGLLGGDLVHASPAEHQATPDVFSGNSRYLFPSLHGNFNGWVQFRKTIPNENITE